MCPAPSRLRARPTRAYAMVRRTRRRRRCGARADGAGWVGPPATRRRLCVLRQIGDQLVAGLEGGVGARSLNVELCVSNSQFSR